MHLAFVAIALALLSVAAWRDLLVRTIPNIISALLLIGGMASRAFEGLAALGWSMLAAGGLCIVLVAIFSRGLLGGGDVKLMSALALGLPPEAVWNLVVATAVAGGIIACGYLLARRLLPHLAPVRSRSLLARAVVVETWRIRTHRSMPYALAIAAGGACVLIPGLGV